VQLPPNLRTTMELPTVKTKLPIHQRYIDPEKVRPLRDHVYMRVTVRRWTKRASGLVVLSERREGRRTETLIGKVVQKREFQLALVLAIGPQVRGLKKGDHVVVPTNRRRGGIALGGVVFNMVETPEASSYEMFLKQGKRLQKYQRPSGNWEPMLCENSYKRYAFQEELKRQPKRDWKDIRCECGSRFRVDLEHDAGRVNPPMVQMPEHMLPVIHGGLLGIIECEHYEGMGDCRICGEFIA